MCTASVRAGRPPAPGREGHRTGRSACGSKTFAGASNAVRGAARRPEVGDANRACEPLRLGLRATPVPGLALAEPAVYDGRGFTGGHRISTFVRAGARTMGTWWRARRREGR